MEDIQKEKRRLETLRELSKDRDIASRGGRDNSSVTTLKKG